MLLSLKYKNNNVFFVCQVIVIAFIVSYFFRKESVDKNVDLDIHQVLQEAKERVAAPEDKKGIYYNCIFRRARTIFYEYDRYRIYNVYLIDTDNNWRYFARYYAYYHYCVQQCHYIDVSFPKKSRIWLYHVVRFYSVSVSASTLVTISGVHAWSIS